MPGTSTGELRAALDAVRSMSAAADNAERVDRLRLLEELKAAACAQQLRLAVELDAETRDDERAAGVKPPRRGRGVPGQLGLALRRSPHAAQRWLWHAKTLTSDLPATLAELAAGRTTEWRALLVAKEAGVLSAEHRRIVDGRIAPTLESSGDRRVEGATRALAQTLDSQAAVTRARRAAGERCVSIRPVADSMARLSILAPMAQAVGAYAALARTADTCTATGAGVTSGGAPRGRGQLMADTAIERLTGQAVATDVPVTVSLVMPVETLLAREGEPGRDTSCVLTGPGGAGSYRVPAAIARDLALTGGAPRWLRRLFTTAGSGRLVQLETHAREFTRGQRQYLTLRDQTCRTPWCDAPIRHANHLLRHSDGGPTTIDNGDGTCAGCNYLAAAPGWRMRAAPDGTVTIIAPTGHAYDSPEPRPPTTDPPPVVERWLDTGPVHLTYVRQHAA